ncbi:hypothetical protein OQA88_11665 [Cercophora sp. LCS_1]
MKVATSILLADPQTDWTGRANDVGNLDTLNRCLNQISAVDYVTTPDINITCTGLVGKPDAVFFAGDLTKWGGHVNLREAILMESSAAEVQGGDLLQDFRSLYDPAWAGNKVKQLNASGPLYFGLGNHDLGYFDNSILSWPDFNGTGSTDYHDYYRHQMWNFINQMHVGYHRTLFSNPRAKYFAVDPRFPVPPDNIDADPAGTFYFQNYSFSYMIDLGPIDVYQLHLFGGDSYNHRKSGLDSLKHKLASRGYTRPVFIVQHIPMTIPGTDYWDDAARDHLLEILRPYNVVGFGVGHWHGAHDLVEISTLTTPRQ